MGLGLGLGSGLANPNPNPSPNPSPNPNPNLQHGLGTRAQRHEREAHEGARLSRRAEHEAERGTAEEAVAEGRLAWVRVRARARARARARVNPSQGLAWAGAIVASRSLDSSR